MTHVLAGKLSQPDNFHHSFLRIAQTDEKSRNEYHRLDNNKHYRAVSGYTQLEPSLHFRLRVRATLSNLYSNWHSVQCVKAIGLWFIERHLFRQLRCTHCDVPRQLQGAIKSPPPSKQRRHSLSSVVWSMESAVLFYLRIQAHNYSRNSFY